MIEGDPHRLVEGMAIAAYAIGATKAYVYIRAEYPLAIDRLRSAIDQARGLRPAWAQHPRQRLRPGGHHQEGRRGLRLRRGDRPDPQHRGQARHAPAPAAVPRRVAACSASRRSSTTSRRWPTSPNIVGHGRRVVCRPWAPKAARAPRSSPCPARSNGPAWSKWPWARASARSCSTSAAASPTASQFKAVQIGGPSGGCIPERASRHRSRLRVAQDRRRDDGIAAAWS